MATERIPLRELLSAQGGKKEENRRNLLRTIMTKPGSQAELSFRSGLSEGTVSSAIPDLQRKGHVVADKDGKRNFVSLPPTTGAAVGVELGFHYTAVVARRVEQGIDEAKTKTVPVGAVAAGAYRWRPDVAEAIRDVVAELGEEEIASVGLGIPRVVDPRSGQLLPPILPPWRDGDDPAVMLEDELRKLGASRPRLTAPRVVTDNDANLAALAESVYRYEKVDTLIAIKASTGIGAGIIIGGKPFRGTRGVAGEIGHVVVDSGGQYCSCGGRGCLEALIGADALVEQARTVLAYRKLDHPESLEQLVKMATSGNLTCQRVLREAATTLGHAIGNLCNVLNPEVVVLGGAFGRPDAVEFTMEPCRTALRHSALHAAVDDTLAPLRVPSAGDDASRLKPLRVEASTLEHAAAHGALVAGVQGTEY